MPFHDLNILYTNNATNLQNTLAFAHELEYSVLALSVTLDGKLPAQLPRISTSTLNIPKSLTILSRLTLTISDTSQNHRVSTLTSTYDLLALCPTNEKSFQLCCSSLDCDIISLDLTQRLSFPVKFKTVASALQRGVRFEICYAGGIAGSNDARRNLISGAAALIRATRGRGIIVSSGAGEALGLRGLWDVVNLATVWGLSQERGKEAVCDEAARVVRLAGMKRSSFRGVVDVVENGMQEIAAAEEPKRREEQKTGGMDAEGAASNELGEDDQANLESPATELKQVTVVPSKTPNEEKAKRKASMTSLNQETITSQVGSDGKPLSKREMKRQAKKARLDRAAGKDDEGSDIRGDAKMTTNSKQKPNGFPIPHETTMVKKKKR